MCDHLFSSSVVASLSYWQFFKVTSNGKKGRKKATGGGWASMYTIMRFRNSALEYKACVLSAFDHRKLSSGYHPSGGMLAGPLAGWRAQELPPTLVGKKVKMPANTTSLGYRKDCTPWLIYERAPGLVSIVTHPLTLLMELWKAWGLSLPRVPLRTTQKCFSSVLPRQPQMQDTPLALGCRLHDLSCFPWLPSLPAPAAGTLEPKCVPVHPHHAHAHHRSTPSLSSSCATLWSSGKRVSSLTGFPGGSGTACSSFLRHYQFWF